MPFEQLNSDSIQVKPLADRTSYIQIEQVAVDPHTPPPDAGDLLPQLDHLADRVRKARSRGASVMLTYGAHLVKNGGGMLVRWLIEHDWVTHVATQGAGIIHDWEFAYQGVSSESVRDNTPRGEFGTWDETGRWINLAALVGGAQGMGLGESMGSLVGNDGLNIPDPDVLKQHIMAEPEHPLTAARADLLHIITRHNIQLGFVDVPHPFKQYSIPAACHEHGVPLTVHPGIGYDIFTNHPLFHGGAIGRGAGIDARIFAHGVMNLTDGVYLSVGSAIMSPQVFEKALSAANNVLLSQGRSVQNHLMAVVDLQDGGGWDWSTGEPPKDHPAYYLRFCKTFHRMGGTLDYLCGDNRSILHNLIARLR